PILNEVCPGPSRSPGSFATTFRLGPLGSVGGVGELVGSVGGVDGVGGFVPSPSGDGASTADRAWLQPTSASVRGDPELPAALARSTADREIIGSIPPGSLRVESHPG